MENYHSEIEVSNTNEGLDILKRLVRSDYIGENYIFEKGRVNGTRLNIEITGATESLVQVKHLGVNLESMIDTAKDSRNPDVIMILRGSDELKKRLGLDQERKDEFEMGLTIYFRDGKLVFANPGLDRSRYDDKSLYPKDKRVYDKWHTELKELRDSILNK